MHAWREFRRTGVMAFCVWQMAAVGLYALPEAARDPMTKWVRSISTPFVNPYILLTSQWQQWSLFSPDPLRRVVTYRVEAERDGKWHVIQTIAPGMVDPLRRATTMKLMERILETNRTQQPLTERFLQVTCRTLRLPPLTHVRLIYHWYILPSPALPYSATEWRALKIPTHDTPGTETWCGTHERNAMYHPFFL